MIMKPGIRKFALTVHVTCSAGTIGAVAAFLVLAIAGLASRDSQVARAAYETALSGTDLRSLRM